MKSALHELPELEDKDKVKRPVDEMIEEILILVRGFAQRPTEIRGWPVALEKVEGEWEQPCVFLIDWPSARSPRGLAGQRLGTLMSEFISKFREIERERLKSGQSETDGEVPQSTSSGQKTNEE